MSDIKLVLAKPTKQNISFLHRCYTSRDIRGEFQPCRKISMEKVKWEVKGIRGSTRRFVFFVEQCGNAIGYAYAHYISAFDHYEIGVTLMPSARDKGIGTLVHQLLVRRMFKKHRARRLYALVSARNLAEINVLETCGFHREGVLREAGPLVGAWHDLVLYGFLSSEAKELTS